MAQREWWSLDGLSSQRLRTRQTGRISTVKWTCSVLEFRGWCFHSIESMFRCDQKIGVPGCWCSGTIFEPIFTGRPIRPDQFPIGIERSFWLHFGSLHRMPWCLSRKYLDDWLVSKYKYWALFLYRQHIPNSIVQGYEYRNLFLTNSWNNAVVRHIRGNLHTCFPNDNELRRQLM